ncbi:MAG: TIR domain-containing protein [Altererythrobacter sp.]|nr:TIR domain-containing protein [Altererythrobacter sp.]
MSVAQHLRINVASGGTQDNRLADVFISYARTTQEQARAVARILVSAGFTIWIDDELPSHRAFSNVIEEKLREAKAVIVLWSSDARASRWVPAEAEIAHNKDKLIQISLDGALPPLPFNRLQCEMMPQWIGDASHPSWPKIISSVAELAGKRAAESDQQPIRLSSTPSAKETMLAVLAFDNVSADQELDYFCDGVAEEIQRTVARGTDLKVVARTSSFQFRGAEKETGNVARALGVSHLLDGSVRRGGERIRISAELVDCSSHSSVWSDRFDGTLDDIFELQETIAESVAQALKVALDPPVAAKPIGPLDYERFLRARAILSGGDYVFDDSAIRAIPLLEAVTSARADFAPAWELLASARASELRSGHTSQSYAEGRTAVIEAAETALSLDPKRSSAFVALAMLEPWGAYTKREALLEDALAAQPNDTVALTELSNFYWSVGRLRDAFAMAERAYELDPMMPSAAVLEAALRAYIGDYQGSVSQHRQLYKRWPDNPGMLHHLLNIAATTGEWDAYDEFIGDIDKFDGWQAADLRAAKAYAEAVRNEDDAVRNHRIERYNEVVEKTGTLPLNVITGGGVFGRAEQALDIAEKASYDYIFEPEGDRAALHFPGTMFGPWSTIKNYPRFVNLCARLGLCDYWVSSGIWPDRIDELPYDFKAEVHKTLTT